jgi:hypothetical protein
MELADNKKMSVRESEPDAVKKPPEIKMLLIISLAILAVAVGLIIFFNQLEARMAIEKEAIKDVDILMTMLDSPESFHVQEIKYNPNAQEASFNEDMTESGDIMIFYSVDSQTGVAIKSYAVFGNGGFYGIYRPDEVNNIEAIARYSIIETWDAEQNISLDVDKIMANVK